MASKSGSSQGWEISPIPVDCDEGMDDLHGVPGQRATRSSVQRFVEPDWASVALEWDAVQLSWAGFLTTEGTACDLADGDVAMLRGWGSQRTLWLNPVLSDPQPMHPDPHERHRGRWPDGDHRTIDLRTDRPRFEREYALLTHRLAR